MEKSWREDWFHRYERGWSVRTLLSNRSGEDNFQIFVLVHWGQPLIRRTRVRSGFWREITHPLLPFCSVANSKLHTFLKSHTRIQQRISLVYPSGKKQSPIKNLSISLFPLTNSSVSSFMPQWKRMPPQVSPNPVPSDRSPSESLSSEPFPLPH